MTRCPVSSRSTRSSGGIRGGGHAFTLTLTDIAIGWTESRSLPRPAKHILAALNHVAAAMPFPILGVDCDNGSEFINDDLLAWCRTREITFTRSRPGNKNGGCHVEQENRAVVRTVVGYCRQDTVSEVLLLNEIWQLQSKLTNYFHPQQKLISPRSARAPRSPVSTKKRRPRSAARSTTRAPPSTTSWRSNAPTR